MRKFAVLALAALLICCLFPAAFANSAEIADPGTANALREQSNKDMARFYHKANYFPERLDGRGPFKVVQRTDGGKKHGDIVYGPAHGMETTRNGVHLFEYSGYSRSDEHFPTMEFPWYAGWSGIKIQNFNLVEAPWRNVSVQQKYGIGKGTFDRYKDDGNPFLTGGTLEHAIVTGLNYAYGRGQKYRDFMYQNKNEKFADRTVYDRNAKPKNGGDWIDYVHVLQPPTLLSWGLGTVYINSSFGGITYLDIPIAPFILQNEFADLAAAFEVLPSGAPAGTPVQIGVRVTSSFQQQVKTSFRWGIVSGDGKSLTAADDHLSFQGDSTAKSGELAIHANGEAMLYANFIMPESDVRVTFEVNGDGKQPEEAYLANNRLDSHPKAVKLITPIGLGYDVLSKKVRFPLADGNAVTARLSLPQGWWNGNAAGALNVVNNAPGLFRDDKVSGNPPVNEDSETIERKPLFHATIERTDFGDDPLSHRWRNLTDPGNPLTKSGSVSYSGAVDRGYKYNYDVCDAAGNCEEHIASGSVSAPFDSGMDGKLFEMFVYNGRDTLPKKTFKEEIEQNSTASKTKKLFWENEPYKFDVIRWMRHVDENGGTYGWTPVDGQYERTFTQQASGEAGWEAERTMARHYEQSRTAARNNTSRKSLYDKAVFATDRELQRFDYPIKSGYYFNPAGTYTFTVQTVTFKPTPADTQDHKDLVAALADSFRYETDLMYINNKKAAVNIRNEPLRPLGGGFERKPGILSARNNKGVDGQVLLTVSDRSNDASRYDKKVEEVEYSQARDGDSHPFWKMVMEGYGESFTLGSNNSYRYREHVKNGQHMYKITETTKVTIIINKDNVNVYTDANMPNGTYYARAWMADVELNGQPHAYNTLGTLKGMQKLDEIHVTVQGSMYDDLNN